MAKHKISKKKFIAAVENTGGILMKIALKLGCSRPCVYDYLRDNPDMRVYVDQETEKILDLAEDGLFSKVKSKDADAIKWVLSRKGKQRGYGDSLALTNDKPKSDEEEVAERLAKLNEADSTRTN